MMKAHRFDLWCTLHKVGGCENGFTRAKDIIMQIGGNKMALRKLECGYLKGFIGEHEYAAMASQVENAHALGIRQGSGEMISSAGWTCPPITIKRNLHASRRLRSASRKHGCVYRHRHRRLLPRCTRSNRVPQEREHYNALKKDTPDIYFTGNSISSTALAELVEICEGKDISINMISKSAPPRGYRVPCFPRDPREEVRQGRSKEAYFLHDR